MMLPSITAAAPRVAAATKSLFVCREGFKSIMSIPGISMDYQRFVLLLIRDRLGKTMPGVLWSHLENAPLSVQSLLQRSPGELSASLKLLIPVPTLRS